MNIEDQYLAQGRELLAKAEKAMLREDRTKTGTYGVFGRQWRHNLLDGFPLLTSKKVFMKGIIYENLWFLTGSTNNNDLRAYDVHIWDKWALPENGELGRMYGAQWRNWPGGVYLAGEAEKEGDSLIARIDDTRSVYQRSIDQISELITGLKERPFSRRHIVSAWNIADMPVESEDVHENVRKGRMCLASCHCMFQFYVEEMTLLERIKWKMLRLGIRPDFNAYIIDDEERMMRELDEEGIPRRKLSCQLYQRSADFCVGVPFNIAGYAMLTMMIAQVVDMAPGDFIHTFGDLHLYSNHVDGLREQLSRSTFPLPRLMINPKIKDIDAFGYDDFKVEDYQSHGKIDFDVAK